jgi:phosphate acetyltransferase
VSFLAALRDRAAARSARIGFPEASEPRTREAIARLAAEGAVQPVVVESAAEIDMGPLPGSGIEVVDPYAPGRRGEVADLLPEISSGGPVDTLRFAVAQLKTGRLDGVVAGARSSTADVVRAGLRILGTAPGIKTVSSSFYMVPTDPSADVLTFTDAGVVPAPTPAQLAEIAESACRARRQVVGDEARVAFLSYSTHGSADGDSVRHVREAMRQFRERMPDVICDGELQADAALVPEVAARKAPDSAVAGRANVLVFPDLDAGNIAYKLVQRLAGWHALGPVLQGLAAPLNDLSRGASVDDIVHVAYITALMSGKTATTKSS